MKLATHLNLAPRLRMRGAILRCIQKFSDRVDNEIYAYNNKHSLRSNIKGYGNKTHYTDSQNSDTTEPSGKELYHLQFSLQAARPELLDTTSYLHSLIRLHGVVRS
jgi:hypothetical protein